MPTIAFLSPKGGVGKTTSAFLFAITIAKIYKVTIIDARPNHPIQTWAAGGNTPGLTVVSDADEDTIIGELWHVRMEALDDDAPSGRAPNEPYCRKYGLDLDHGREGTVQLSHYK